MEYKGYLIEPNNTGYVNYDFYKPESELIEGNGETLEDCKTQIDNLNKNPVGRPKIPGETSTHRFLCTDKELEQIKQLLKSIREKQ
jgi:hypothetical protein